MKQRSAISIQKDVVFALFTRDMIARFSSYTFGNIWILLEPLLLMIFFILIFGARGRGEFGYSEPPIFVFAAFLPFKILWQSTMKNNVSAIGGAKGLMGFRQVRLFDVFLARSLLEIGLFLVVGTIIAVGFLWLGFSPIPANILETLYYCLILWVFASGFGMLVCLVSQFAKEIGKVIGLLTMPLLFLSAVIYPMTIVPQQYHKYFWYNPLVHAMELIRENWLAAYKSPIAEDWYLVMWTICTLALAISTYRLRWQRVVAS